MKRFKLVCLGTDPQHTKFNLFDGRGANCGTITILTEDMATFLTREWEGDIDWNGKIPEPKQNRL